MAAAPMYVQRQLVGVLSLASSEPHAFDRCRLVWLLAMVLAPFAAALRYTSRALEMEAFIAVGALVHPPHCWSCVRGSSASPLLPLPVLGARCRCQR